MLKKNNEHEGPKTSYNVTEIAALERQSPQIIQRNGQLSQAQKSQQNIVQAAQQRFSNGSLPRQKFIQMQNQKILGHQNKSIDNQQTTSFQTQNSNTLQLQQYANQQQIIANHSHQNGHTHPTTNTSNANANSTNMNMMRSTKKSNEKMTLTPRSVITKSSKPVTQLLMIEKNRIPLQQRGSLLVERTRDTSASTVQVKNTQQQSNLMEKYNRQPNHQSKNPAMANAAGSYTQKVDKSKQRLLNEIMVERLKSQNVVRSGAGQPDSSLNTTQNGGSGLVINESQSNSRALNQYVEASHNLFTNQKKKTSNQQKATKMDLSTIVDSPSGCNSALAMHHPTNSNESSSLRPQMLPRSNFLFNSITVGTTSKVAENTGLNLGGGAGKKRGKETARWDLSIQNLQAQSRVDSMISPADTNQKSGGRLGGKPRTQILTKEQNSVDLSSADFFRQQYSTQLEQYNGGGNNNHDQRKIIQKSTLEDSVLILPPLKQDNVYYTRQTTENGLLTIKKDFNLNQNLRESTLRESSEWRKDQDKAERHLENVEEMQYRSKGVAVQVRRKLDRSNYGSSSHQSILQEPKKSSVMGNQPVDNEFNMIRNLQNRLLAQNQNEMSTFEDKQRSRLEQFLNESTVGDRRSLERIQNSNMGGIAGDTKNYYKKTEETLNSDFKSQFYLSLKPSTIPNLNSKDGSNKHINSNLNRIDKFTQAMARQEIFNANLSSPSSFIVGTSKKLCPLPPDKRFEVVQQNIQNNFNQSNIQNSQNHLIAAGQGSGIAPEANTSMITTQQQQINGKNNRASNQQAQQMNYSSFSPSNSIKKRRNMKTNNHSQEKLALKLQNSTNAIGQTTQQFQQIGGKGKFKFDMTNKIGFEFYDFKDKSVVAKNDTYCLKKFQPKSQIDLPKKFKKMLYKVANGLLLDQRDQQTIVCALASIPVAQSDKIFQEIHQSYKDFVPGGQLTEIRLQANSQREAQDKAHFYAFYVNGIRKFFKNLNPPPRLQNKIEKALQNSDPRRQDQKRVLVYFNAAHTGGYKLTGRPEQDHIEQQKETQNKLQKQESNIEDFDQSWQLLLSKKVPQPSKVINQEILKPLRDFQSKYMQLSDLKMTSIIEGIDHGLQQGHCMPLLSKEPSKETIQVMVSPQKTHLNLTVSKEDSVQKSLDSLSYELELSVSNNQPMMMNQYEIQESVLNQNNGDRGGAKNQRGLVDRNGNFKGNSIYQKNNNYGAVSNNGGRRSSLADLMTQKGGVLNKKRLFKDLDLSKVQPDQSQNFQNQNQTCPTQKDDNQNGAMKDFKNNAELIDIRDENINKSIGKNSIEIDSQSQQIKLGEYFFNSQTGNIEIQKQENSDKIDSERKKMEVKERIKMLTSKLEVVDGQLKRIQEKSSQRNNSCQSQNERVVQENQEKVIDNEKESHEIATKSTKFTNEMEKQKASQIYRAPWPVRSKLNELGFPAAQPQNHPISMQQSVQQKLQQQQTQLHGMNHLGHLRLQEALKKVNVKGLGSDEQKLLSVKEYVEKGTTFKVDRNNLVDSILNPTEAGRREGGVQRRANALVSKKAQKMNYLKPRKSTFESNHEDRTAVQNQITTQTDRAQKIQMPSSLIKARNAHQQRAPNDHSTIK